MNVKSSRSALLAAMAVLAVALVALAAIPAVAEDGDAADVTTISSADLLSKAVGGVLTLDQNYVLSDSLVVTADMTIDLNGFDLSGTGFHVIEVKTGKLAIKDASNEIGSVVQSGKTYAALMVDIGAEVKIDGGYFHNTDVGAYYVIKNCGTVTINEAKLKNESNGSSVIANGYFNYEDYNKVAGANGTSYPANVAPVMMTINGGEYNGKCYVKNDDYGVMAINGGNFVISEKKGAALMNAGTMTIGSADGKSIPIFTGTPGVVLNFDDPDNRTADPGTVTVNGVKAESADSLAVISSGYTIGTIVLKDENVWAGKIISAPKEFELNGTVGVGSSQVTFTGVVAGTDGIVVGAGAGSVEISGSMDASTNQAKITASSGDVILKDLTINTGTLTLDKSVSVEGTVTVVKDAKMVIGNGATLTVASGAVFKNNGTVEVQSSKSIRTVAGATIDFGKFVDSEGDSVYPDCEDGTIIERDGTQYTIYHAQTTAGKVQFGIAIGDVVYDGSKHSGEFDNLAVTSFDNIFTGVYGAPEGTIYQVKGDLSTAGYENAGSYYLYVSFSMNNGETAVTVKAMDLPLEVKKADLDIKVTIEGWHYGEFDAEKNSPNAGFAFGKEAIENPYSSVKYTVDGKDFATVAADLKAGDYTLVATFQGADNFADETVEVKFTVEKQAMKLEVFNVDDSINFWGTKASRYHDVDYKTVLDGKTILVSGTVYWIENVNEGASEIIFGDDKSKGYYAVIGIRNLNEFPIEIKYGLTEDKVAKLTAFSGNDNWLAVLVSLGTDLTAETDFEFEITPINDSYADETWGVQYDLKRPSQAGYADNAKKAAEDFTAAGGKHSNDVSDKTVWMVWSQFGLSKDKVYGELYKNGELVYREQVKSDDGVRGWYFSFAENQPSYSKETTGVTMPLDSSFVGKYPGVYTLKIVCNDKPVAENEVSVNGAYTAGYGFEFDSAAAIDGIKKAFAANGGKFVKDDVIAKTIWMAYYQNGFTKSKEIVGNLYFSEAEEFAKDAKPVFTEAMLKDDGLRCWYMSFDDQLKTAGVELQKGYYRIDIVADGVVIATATCQINSIDSKVDFVTPTDEELSAFGITADDIQRDVVFKNDEIRDGTCTVTVSGKLIFSNGLAKWNTDAAGPAGYYLAFTAKADVDWAVAKLETVAKDYVQSGQMFVVYIGKDLEELTEFTVKVDFDDNGTFYNEVAYAFDVSGLKLATFDVVLMDEMYGTDGVVFAQVSIGGGFILPNGPDASKDFVGWSIMIDGKETVYSAGAYVKVVDSLIGDDGRIVFTAIYLGSQQRDSYEVSATVSEDGKTLTVTTTSKQVENYRNLSANHYYIITMTDASGKTVMDRLIASPTILNGKNVYEETFNVALDATFGTGCVVIVEFKTDYAMGKLQISEPAVIEKLLKSESGFKTDAKEACDAINKALKDQGRTDGIDQKDVDSNTAYTVFTTTEDLNGKELTAYVYSGDEIVYAEKMTFAAAGAHAFYYSFNDSAPSHSQGSGIVVPMKAGTTASGNYDVIIIDSDGNTIVKSTFTA